MVYDHRANRGGVRWLTIKKDSYLWNLFIDSDREKNSASNDTIFNCLIRILNNLLGQKLIFWSFVCAQDVPYYSTNIEKKCDIRDHHILFYRSIKITNGTKTKKIFEYLRGTPGSKNSIFMKCKIKWWKTIRIHRAIEMKNSFCLM